MSPIRLIARPMLASMFVMGGINSLRNADAMAERAEPVTERLEPVVDQATSSMPIHLDQRQLVILNGVLHVVGGAMLATGRMPRLASLALAATMVPTTLGGHRFWEESDPQARQDQQTHFFKNVSMMGGLLLASLDTEGRPSVGWRAKRGARHARDAATEHASALNPF
ncbi:MAG TPA: DoxX family protein [Nocardioidaceae bacterium]|nr:DoxX family protein [Nocardioidaceae bacterium]